MVAHAELPEAQRAQPVLEPVDAAQALGRDLGAVGEARRQAGELRLVPGRQPQRARQRAHVGLGQAGVDHRVARAALVGGGQAGAVIAEIVEVGAEQDLAQAQRVGARARDLQQLGLAVVAAVGGVLREARALELVRLDDLEARADQGGQLARRGALALGHGDRDGGQADAAVAEHVVRDPQQQRRVDAAREADQRRAVAGDDRRAGAGAWRRAGAGAGGAGAGSGSAIVFGAV